MKMSKPLYDALAADLRTVAEVWSVDLDEETPPSSLWHLFHGVMRDRSYDDTHPGFILKHWKRILPHEDRFWLDRFYKDEDLNDDHIRTALRKIARTTQKELTT